jgi:hypothetical protein
MHAPVIFPLDFVPMSSSCANAWFKAAGEPSVPIRIRIAGLPVACVSSAPTSLALTPLPPSDECVFQAALSMREVAVNNWSAIPQHVRIQHASIFRSYLAQSNRFSKPHACSLDLGPRWYPHISSSGCAGEVAAGKHCFHHRVRLLPPNSLCIHLSIFLSTCRHLSSILIFEFLQTAQQQRVRTQRAPAAASGFRYGR